MWGEAETWPVVGGTGMKPRRWLDEIKKLEEGT
jgi:hypothetical protein